MVFQATWSPLLPGSLPPCSGWTAAHVLGCLWLTCRKDLAGVFQVLVPPMFWPQSLPFTSPPWLSLYALGPKYGRAFSSRGTIWPSVPCRRLLLVTASVRPFLVLVLSSSWLPYPTVSSSVRISFGLERVLASALWLNIAPGPPSDRVAPHSWCGRSLLLLGLPALPALLPSVASAFPAPPLSWPRLGCLPWPIHGSSFPW